MKPGAGHRRNRLFLSWHVGVLFTSLAHAAFFFYLERQMCRKIHDLGILSCSWWGVEQRPLPDYSNLAPRENGCNSPPKKKSFVLKAHDYLRVNFGRRSWECDLFLPLCNTLGPRSNCPTMSINKMEVGSN